MSSLNASLSYNTALVRRLPPSTVLVDSAIHGHRYPITEDLQNTLDEIERVHSPASKPWHSLLHGVDVPAVTPETKPRETSTGVPDGHDDREEKTVNPSKKPMVLHVSLSRPFALKTNQRDDFRAQLRRATKDVETCVPWLSRADCTLTIRGRFELSFARACALLNDEKTRAFIALEVGKGHEEVHVSVHRASMLLMLRPSVEEVGAKGR